MIKLIKHDTMNDAFHGLKSSLKNHETNMHYVIHDKTTILDGTNTKADYEYIDDHGLEVYFLHTKGGVTVLYEGNLSTGFIGEYKSNDKLMHDYIIAFCKWLYGRGLKPVFDGNDLLIDGYKVCAFSSNYDEATQWGLATITFTVNIDVDLVRAVCNKPMEKVPKGLSEYGITVEDIMNNVVLPFAERH